MRILMIADPHPEDIHDGFAPLDAPSTLERVLLKVGKLDFIIDAGDRVSIREEDKNCSAQFIAIKHTKFLMQAFQAHASGVPRMHVPGNHDDGVLSREQQQRWLGAVGTYSAYFDDSDLTVISWAANVKRPSKDGSINASRWDLFDLQKEIDAARGKSVILVSHMPLDHRTDEIKGRNPFQIFYENHANIGEILAGSKIPVVSFSGHMHRTRNHLDHANACFSLPSLTMVNSRAKPEFQWSGYATLDVSQDFYTLRVYNMQDERPVIEQTHDRHLLGRSWTPL